MRDSGIDLEANRLDASEALDSNRMAFTFLCIVLLACLLWAGVILAGYGLYQWVSK